MTEYREIVPDAVFTSKREREREREREGGVEKMSHESDENLR